MAWWGAGVGDGLCGMIAVVHIAMFGLFWLPFSGTLGNLAVLGGAAAMLASNFVPVQRSRGGARTAMLVAAAAFGLAAVIGSGTVMRTASLLLAIANLLTWARSRSTDD